MKAPTEFTLVNEAQYPEDIFGKLPSNKSQASFVAIEIFKKIRSKLHPDRYYGSELEAFANDMLAKLNSMHDKAMMAIETGTYGKPKALLTLTTKNHTYQIFGFVENDNKQVNWSAHFHVCYGKDEQDNNVWFKLAKTAADNTLLKQEVKMLSALTTDNIPPEITSRWPKPLDQFETVIDGVNRVVVVIPSMGDGWYSVAEIEAKHPGTHSVSEKHVAWMWRRLLETLTHLHSDKVVHGNLNRDTILFHPATHKLCILDWTSLAKLGDKPETKNNAPPELANGTTVTTDIFMAARALLPLLKTPGPITNHLMAATLPNWKYRLLPMDTYRQFDELIHDRLGWPKQFLVFAFPTI